MFNPRPGQKEVLEYKAGWLGVAAVPGSGKTHTLSSLAASLVVNANLEDDQEILIVTLVNSAVNNFSNRVATFIKESGLLPDLGYRVRTLHGLAHDIVRERPDLVGLSDRFIIVEERETTEIIQSIVRNRATSLSSIFQEYVNPENAERNDSRFRDQWLNLNTNIASNVIRMAKDLEITPAQFHESMEKFNISDPILRFTQEVYSDYQRSLNFRSAVDFDDLIRLALKTITFDPDFLSRLQHRWPYILEDEAQDSSRLQEIILSKLAGELGNWVRVGDPNQAIFETFTTASPKYLRSFLANERVIEQDLSYSGRSTPSIIKLANHLIDWSRSNHPVEELRDSLALPYIQPTARGDPQPNPPDLPDGIFLSKTGGSPDDEVKKVVSSLKAWLPDHGDQTVAVLVPRNERGTEIVAQLKANNIPYLELLKSSYHTRQTAKILSVIISHLADPAVPKKLAEVFKTINQFEEDETQKQINESIYSLLVQSQNNEQFLNPHHGDDWIETLEINQNKDIIQEKMEFFRFQLTKWEKAALLPIDQLLLIISQDLFKEPGDLALVQKLALSLERSGKTHLDWRLPNFASELTNIANNERKFLGFSEDENGFNPELHKGKVIVATLHKAKGLEWDRVYLMSVNNYDFPSNQPDDTFISEKWFIRDHLNLEAETIAKLQALSEENLGTLYSPEGTASAKARLDYCSERLRLFYVGITRAKRELIVTWNTGRNERIKCRPSLPFTALRSFWENRDVHII